MPMSVVKRNWGTTCQRMKSKTHGKKLRIYINRSGEVFLLKKHNCLEYRERLLTGVVKESTTWMELKSREKPRLCKDRMGELCGWTNIDLLILTLCAIVPIQDGLCLRQGNRFSHIDKAANWFFMLLLKNKIFHLYQFRKNTKNR